MNDLLNKYKNWLITNNLSCSTIITYIYKIKKLLNELGEVNGWTEDKIIEFLVVIKNINSTATYNSYRHSLKSFLTFIKSDIKIPKTARITKSIPESITEEYFETEVIKNVVEKVVNNPIKVKAILYFMFYTGLRVGELEIIKRQDIDLDKKLVKVFIPKTREERIIFFNDKVVYFLKSYFLTENEENNLFNITTYGIKNIFQRLNVFLEDINFHPHLMRHSYGTHLRSKGMKIEDIKELMGHKNISTTMRYAHANMEDIRKKYDKYMN